MFNGNLTPIRNLIGEHIKTWVRDFTMGSQYNTQYATFQDISMLNYILTFPIHFLPTSKNMKQSIFSIRDSVLQKQCNVTKVFTMHNENVSVSVTYSWAERTRDTRTSLFTIWTLHRKNIESVVKTFKSCIVLCFNFQIMLLVTLALEKKPLTSLTNIQLNLKATVQVKRHIIFCFIFFLQYYRLCVGIYIK